jgi:hypothetical protein
VLPRIPVTLRRSCALAPLNHSYGTGSSEHLTAALAPAGRLPEAPEEARLLLAGNPNWRIGDLARDGLVVIRWQPVLN